jgi:hypothetical protein
MVYVCDLGTGGEKRIRILCTGHLTEDSLHLSALEAEDSQDQDAKLLESCNDCRIYSGEPLYCW